MEFLFDRCWDDVLAGRRRELVTGNNGVKSGLLVRPQWPTAAGYYVGQTVPRIRASRWFSKLSRRSAIALSA